MEPLPDIEPSLPTPEEAYQAELGAFEDSIDFLTHDSIKQMRKDQHGLVVDAGAEVIAIMDTADKDAKEATEAGDSKVASIIRAAKPTNEDVDVAEADMEKQFSGLAEVLVAQHLEKEDNPILYEHAVKMVQKYSINRMDDDQWLHNKQSIAGLDVAGTSGDHLVSLDYDGLHETFAPVKPEVVAAVAPEIDPATAEKDADRLEKEEAAFNEKWIKAEKKLDQKRTTLAKLANKLEGKYGKKGLDSAEYQVALTSWKEAQSGLGAMLIERATQLGSSEEHINMLVTGDKLDAIMKNELGLSGDEMVTTGYVGEQMKLTKEQAKLRDAELENEGAVKKFGKRVLGKVFGGSTGSKAAKAAVIAGGATAVLAGPGLVVAGAAGFGFARSIVSNKAISYIKRKRGEGGFDMPVLPDTKELSISDHAAYLEHTGNMVNDSVERQVSSNRGRAGMVGGSLLVGAVVGGGMRMALESSDLGAIADRASTAIGDIDAQNVLDEATSAAPEADYYDPNTVIADAEAIARASQEAAENIDAQNEMLEQLSEQMRTVNVGQGEGITHMLADMREQFGITEDQLSDADLYNKIYEPNEAMFAPGANDTLFADAPDGAVQETYAMGGDYGVSIKGEHVLTEDAYNTIRQAMYTEANVEMLDTTALPETVAANEVPASPQVAVPAVIEQVEQGTDYTERAAAIDQAEAVTGVVSPERLEAYLARGSSGETAAAAQLIELSSRLEVAGTQAVGQIDLDTARELIAENRDYIASRASEVYGVADGDITFSPGLMKYFEDAIEAMLDETASTTGSQN